MTLRGYSRIVNINTSALSFSAEVLSATLACSCQNYTDGHRDPDPVNALLDASFVAALWAELKTALSLCNTSAARPGGASVPSVSFNSKWFQSYSRAVLESDPNRAGTYVTNALDVLNITLNQSLLKENERKAISRAIHYLRLIEHHELRKAS